MGIADPGPATAPLPRQNEHKQLLRFAKQRARSLRVYRCGRDLGESGADAFEQLRATAPARRLAQVRRLSDQLS